MKIKLVMLERDIKGKLRFEHELSSPCRCHAQIMPASCSIDSMKGGPLEAYNGGFPLF